MVRGLTKLEKTKIRASYQYENIEEFRKENPGIAKLLEENIHNREECRNLEIKFTEINNVLVLDFISSLKTKKIDDKK